MEEIVRIFVLVILFEIGAVMMTAGLTALQMSPEERKQCNRSNDYYLEIYCRKYAPRSWVFTHLLALILLLTIATCYR